MVVIRFSKYRANKPDLEIKTPILDIARRGDEVEIEFDGMPSNQELKEIARRLGLPKIEITSRRLIRKRIEPKKIVLRKRKASR